MKLTDILTASRIDLDLEATSKDEVIERLVALVVRTVDGVDLNTVLKAVRAREQLMSTGVGNSVAIPHGKTNAVTSLVAAFGRCAEPVEYEALDGRLPVRHMRSPMPPPSHTGSTAAGGRNLSNPRRPHANLGPLAPMVRSNGSRLRARPAGR